MKSSSLPRAVFPVAPYTDRADIARAFVAKMVYNLPTTRALLDRLETDSALRRICGWERKSDIPVESTFSRAAAEFANTRLPEQIHEALIKKCYADEMIVGHISRDATAIEAREKPAQREPVVNAEAKRGRHKQICGKHNAIKGSK